MASKTRKLLLSISLIASCLGVPHAHGQAPYMPDAKLTPGNALPVTKADLCESALAVHNIGIAKKREVFDLYGIRGEAPGGHNVDHLIPVGLGGSNSIKNLWPQPLSGEWNYALKNRLERRLHKMVCRGELDLKQAQTEIASDWVAAYKKYVVKPKPDSASRTPEKPPQ